MGKKKPRKRENPNISKTPKEGESQRKFKWSFDQAELEDGPWSWKDISMKKFLKDVLKKLQYFETMRWPEVEGRNNHFVHVEELNKKAKARLDELNLEPVKLFSLRLTGRERVLGYQVENFLYVLWWDPKHTVYPTKKKHT